MAALLPFRWHGHDVCALLEAHTVRWVARDVLEAVDRDPGDFTADPGHEPLRYAQHRDAAAYPFETIRTLIADTDLGAELLTFLRLRESAIEAMGYGNVTRYATSPAQYDGPLYPIARAARILDADPAIAIGEQLLFQWLLDQEWIHRRGAEYAPGELSIVAGRLAVVPRRLPNQANAYPQVVLTDRGLTELHTALGGSDPTVLEQEPA